MINSTELLEALYIPFETKILGGVPVKFRSPDPQCTGIYTRLILSVQEEFFTKKFLTGKPTAEIFTLCGQKISEIFAYNEKGEDSDEFIKLIMVWSTNGGFELMSELIQFCFPEIEPRRLKPTIYTEAFGIAAQAIAAQDS